MKVTAAEDPVLSGAQEDQAPDLESRSGRDYAEEIAVFGARLRELRHLQKMSLEELADRTSLSVGLLSQLERGIGNPSFMTLMRIADALHTQISHFFFYPGEANQIVRRNQRKRMFFPQPGLTIELLTPDLNRRLQVLWIRYEAGLRTEEGPFIHEGEECVCLVRGTLELHINEQVFVLEEGDAITFDCLAPHWYYNPGPGEAEIFSAMTPPGF